MQGFNQGRYVPPSAEGVLSGNQLHSRRAPGTLRPDGTQTVRFELPFAIWCHGCPPHTNSSTGEKEPGGIIGQGVRFNAVKRKVGKYYSTPIWEFEIKHAVCGGKIVVRTDPERTRYVVVSGGKERDYGEEGSAAQEGEVLTPAEREKRKEDAFAALEGKIEEKVDEGTRKKRVEELVKSRERDWRDPWLANSRAREGFRRERKVLKREEEKTEDLRRRLGTEIEILPEREEDAKRAKLITFGADERGDGGRSGSRHGTAASGAALFKSPRSASTLSSSRSAKKRAAESQKDVLRRQVLQNTRAVTNPFG